MSQGAEPRIATPGHESRAIQDHIPAGGVARELRHREKLVTVWSPHYLPALLEITGLINQTT